MQSSHAIKTKITHCQKNGSALKKGLRWNKKIIHVPQNTMRVWTALEQTPQFCATTYSFIGIADSSLQFLHKYFNLHSYKTWVVQELQNTVSSATQIFDINCWMVWKKMKFMICVGETKLIFLSTDSWINKISTTGQKKTVNNCIWNDHTV